MNVHPVLLVNLVLLWLTIGVLFLLVIGLARRQHRSVESTSNDRFQKMLKPGMPAPDFSARLLNGEPVTSQGFSGRDVVYIFFGTNCEPCKKKLPELEAVKDSAASLGLELLVVSIGEEEETAQFFRDHPTSVRVLVAPRATNSFMADFGVPGTPSYVAVNASGVVVDSNVLTAEVTTLLSGWGTLMQSSDTRVSPVAT